MKKSGEFIDLLIGRLVVVGGVAESTSSESELRAGNGFSE